MELVTLQEYYSAMEVRPQTVLPIWLQLTENCEQVHVFHQLAEWSHMDVQHAWSTDIKQVLKQSVTRTQPVCICVHEIIWSVLLYKVSSLIQKEFETSDFISDVRFGRD